MKKTSSVILRIGIALVIIWFGYQQLSDPTSWLAYLPTWITNLPLSQLSIIYLNGWFEMIFGVMLFFGVYTRWVALLIALHLADITYTVGYGAIGVRDFGLVIATFSIFFQGSSPFSIDMFFSDDEVIKTPPPTISPVAPARQNYFNEIARGLPANQGGKIPPVN